ncbi:MAG: hypothetical protein M3203_08315 [Actinomycetota bacterium]|nr:hypothetical protein [Actinomycetota bacterium]
MLGAVVLLLAAIGAGRYSLVHLLASGRRTAPLVHARPSSALRAAHQRTRANTT